MAGRPARWLRRARLVARGPAGAQASPAGAPGGRADPAGRPADGQDVRACYRLLLGRAPDPGGLAHYEAKVADGAMSVEALVEEFLGSEEFLRHYAGTVSVPRVTTEIVVDGFTMVVDPRDWAVGSPLVRTGAYEPEVTAEVLALLGPGDCFVDVGANVGWFALQAARAVGEHGRVVAVEPNPANVSMLERSLEANGWRDRVEVVCAAAGAGPGLAALETDASNGKMIPLDPASGPAGLPLACSYVVPIRTLDEILASARCEKVDVVKIDTEGAEPLVLAGAPALLRRHRPVIVSEFFPRALQDTAGVDPRRHLARLRAAGYELTVVGAGPRAVDDDTILGALEAAGIDHVDLVARPGPETGRAR